MLDLLNVASFNFFIFIIIISILVFVHEFGHYFVAKINKVKIEVFSIGFGKEIFGFNDKSGTRWKFSIIPLGGYVKMYGDANAASQIDSTTLKKLTKEQLRLTFANKPLLVRIAVVAAGPLANFIFALILMFSLNIIYGTNVVKPIISKISDNSAASRAGMMVGDKITRFNDVEIKDFSDLINQIHLLTSPSVAISFERNGEEKKINIDLDYVNDKNHYNEEIKIYRLGILCSDILHLKLSALESVEKSFRDFSLIIKSNMIAVWQIIKAERTIKDLGGALKIAKYSGESAKLGIANLIWFMSIISIALGLINLYPIPGLDGGHLLFYIYEFIFRKPLSEKIQEYCFRLGFSFLILLAIVALTNDIRSFNLF